MIAVKEQQDTYLSTYSRLEKRFAESDPEWLHALRKRAILRFADLGFPTTRNEEWKYTNVAPIARTAFQLARREARLNPAVSEQLQRSPLACVR